MENVQAIVENIVFASDDGMYSVLRVSNKAYGIFSAVYRGNAPYLGENISMDGEWVEHPRFGRQFNIVILKIVEPTSTEGIERFLASGAIPGVGPVTAARIVDKFGADTLDIFANHPKRLAEVKGISKKKAEQIAEAYNSLSELRELMLFLESNGISSGYAARLHAVYGSTAIIRIKEDPYCLARDVDGIGFITADKIAMSLGLERDCEERIAAGIAYTLQTAAGKGHTCIPEQVLVDKASEVLRIEHEPVQDEFNRLMKRDELRIEETHEGRLVYPEYLYHCEVGAAKRLLALRDSAGPLKHVRTESIINKWEQQAGITLADEQREAIHASLKYGVFVLTGGPGTGKTTVVKGILNVLEKAGCRILLAAPTGRAARRLSESSGHVALTVHRLLEYQPGSQGYYNFGKDDEDPLDAEAIIIDEASMMDIALTYHLLKAVRGGTRLIFVGDMDQLPSVGAGNVLHDIINSNKMPVVRLTNVFRQAEVSPIVTNAHKINAGRAPVFTEGDDSDFQIVEFTDEKAAADFVAKKYAELTSKDDWRSVQVLSPMHKNTCGVQNLNKLLQACVNPPSIKRAEITFPSGVFRVGDKVMQMKNNYEKDVFNGDIGRIVAIDGKDITVAFPDRPEGELVIFAQGETNDLALAYAMSVHKSQGSEYPIVILVMVNSHYIMLQRNLIYTAVTRAKERVIIVGMKTAVNRAVSNDKSQKRYSLLAERLQDSFEVY
ncbi:MAG: ATP-dependent RecD-like DNA helicase [Phascolarctobacterium sp.]|nr:ATP-dependent RecD-like DNA helicase [Phascolarctobacterium sp.]